MDPDLKKIQSELKRLADPKHAEISKRFFKTGSGQYGEGDIFAGIRMPILRKLAKKYYNLPINTAEVLLASGIHEERMLALLILMKIYKNGDDNIRGKIYHLYMKNTKYINNWDLVDVTAAHIVGHYLSNKNKNPLYQLAESTDLWERRIAIIATFFFIKQNLFDETRHIAEVLLNDDHDLIHKAVGWMLREVGNRDQATEEAFLKTHYQQMPRTMLRYAIEKFPEPLRQSYLKGEI